MPSLADLFNPTFLMFLGILVLVVALLVVYFETKNREQNHKITAMLSLVSSLAEEINSIKFSLTQITLHQNGGFFSANENENFPLAGIDRPTGVFRKNDNSNLISVSDDDSDSENSESDDEIDLESVNSSDSSNLDDEEPDNSSNDNHNDVKILKLNIHSSKNILQENTDNLDLDYHNEIDDLEEFDDEDVDELNDELNDELSETHSVSGKQSIDVELSENLFEGEDNNLENQLNDTIDENNNSILDISSSDFKTININLEDSNTENIDYKKLSIPKLRSIVAEKKLSTDTSKLKKPDLLKLLGIE